MVLVLVMVVDLVVVVVILVVMVVMVVKSVYLIADENFFYEAVWKGLYD